jgi:hypothetical protein
MEPSRDDPCPCGSGKKYKYCCLAAGVAAPADVIDLTWRRIRERLEDYPTAMLRFVEETYGPVAAEVVRIGGSGAQREMIEDMLLLALMHSGEVEKARTLLDRRLHRRPSLRDTRWRGLFAA